MDQNMHTVGSFYKDFIVVKETPLIELQSTLVELVHQPTGAKVMHIKNDDQENLFCLSFQTLPQSSNGVAHILEHTVLCGSKKFPIKDPFFAMTRRSLNTYMNALTGQDFTCYPASSCVEKDFYNLLDVYLDAVFHPLLRKVSFLQEGHRLQFSNDKKLENQGIVFNEMKGAMSSIESRLWEELSKHLTPDLTYCHNSGGNPKEIAHLTYEELIDFHKMFYHPSRCLFFFYGNLPLTKHLDKILPYLQNVEKLPSLPPLAKQTRFKSAKKVEGHFPIAKDENPAKKTQIAFSWLTTTIENQSDILALQLIESILLETDASPLNLALLKSGHCTQVSSSLDHEMSEIPFTIVCKGCDEKDADPLEKVIFKALKAFKVSHDEVEASLHQMEFERSEIGAESIPFGLTLFMRAGLIKQHGSEPENALLIHSLFHELRQKLQDSNYLKNLVQKYLIDNPHFVRLVMKPDPHLEDRERQEEEKALEMLQKSMTEEEKTKIEMQAAHLSKYQDEQEHQSIECLPKVTLKDVPSHAKKLELQSFENLYFHSCFTNQILYADLVFELPELSEEEMTLVSLFAKLIPELGLGGKNYAETLDYQMAYIGGFDVSLATSVPFKDPKKCKPILTLRAKAMYRNSQKLFDLFKDVIDKIDFDDLERLKEWLCQHATSLQTRLTKNAISYATQIALSGFSLSSMINNLWYGLPYYNFIQDQAKKDPQNLAEKLKTLGQKILKTFQPKLLITCDDQFFKKIKNNTVLNFIQSGKYIEPHFHLNLKMAPSQARIIAAPVAFTVWAMKSASFLDHDAAYLLISTELFSNIILHKEIREKHGAYGSGASYAPSTGNFHFYSYRDPNLSKTVDTFKKAIELLANQQFNDRELEEAKLGVIQTLDSPTPPSSRAMLAYSWDLSGRTYELRDAFRKQVLQASKEDISQAVKKHLQSKDAVLVSLLGKDLLEKERAKLSSSLTILPIED